MNHTHGLNHTQSTGDTEEYSLCEFNEILERVGGHSCGFDRILIIGGKTPVQITASPIGKLQGEDRAEKRETQSISLHANASVLENGSEKEIGLAQDQDIIGFTIKGKLREEEVLDCRLYFNPFQDEIVGVNDLLEHIFLANMNEALSSDRNQSNLAQAFNPYHPTFIEPGYWSVSTRAGLHLLDISIQRRECLITSVQNNTLPGESSQTSLERVKFQETKANVAAAPRKALTTTVDSPSQTSAIARTKPLMPYSLEQLQIGVTIAIDSSTEKGKYTLTRGKTIMAQLNSIVFQADYSESLGKKIVVKIIKTSNKPKGATQVVKATESWLEEVQNHFKLSEHPSIASLYNADSRFLSFYIEYIDAPSIASYCLQTTNNPICTLYKADAKIILTDIADALSYIHSQGIIHNDIKPANILYSKDCGAILIDFGLSIRDSGGRYRTGGSPWYIPPEYISEGIRGKPGDIWALGIVMLFTLQKLPLPERRHPKICWWIDNIQKNDNDGDLARNTMRQWLIYIRDVKEGLDLEGSKIENIVWGMLQPVASRRTKALQLVFDMK